MCDIEKKTYMKAFKFTFILALMASITLVSCDNEPLTGTFIDESGVPIGTVGGDGDGSVEVVEPFFAEVDTVEFSETLLEAYIFNNRLWIRGTDAATSKITLGLPVDVSAGDYTIDAATYTGIYEENVAPDTYFTRADSGTITILAHDTVAKTISGKFNFISTPTASANPVYNITVGEFNVSY